MLKIQLGSCIADLNDEQLSIVRTSPYPGVATENQSGNFIFNFSLPATPELKEALQYAHRPQSAAAVVSIPYRIDAGSGLIWEGTARVAEASDNEYEIFCPVENGDFNVQAKRVKLQELDLGGVRPLEPVRYLVSAATTEDIIVDEVILLPDDILVYPLEFDDISVNIDSILNSSGDTLVINVTGTIVISFGLYADITRGIIEVRVRRSGNDLFISELKQGINFVHTELDVTIYDNLELIVTARREPYLYTKAGFTISS